MSFSPQGFECTQCGDCCKNLNAENTVLFFPQDVQTLSEYLKIPKEEFVSTYLEVVSSKDETVRDVAIFTLKNKFSVCPFLNSDNRCGVHDAKPTQCSRGPYGFFFNGETTYDCMKDVPLTTWSSLQFDRDFVQSVVSTSTPTSKG